ncbi:MAG: helical backbone metal receptor [Bacteroidota bacterium]
MPDSPYFRLAGLLLLVLLSCQSSEKKKLVSSAPLLNQQVTDDLGRAVSLNAQPEKVVSLAPNLTEIIFAIGAEDKLVARSQACDFPEETADYPEVITYPELDLEQIVATEADLLVANDEIFTPERISQMERTGIPVYIQRYRTLDDVYQGIRKLGDLLDVTAGAQHIADSLQQLETRITEETKDQVKYNTMVLISSNPLLVVGGQGYIHEIIEKAGGKNLFGDIDKPYHETTVEEILKRQPEFLILPSTDDQAYQNLLALYPPLYNTPADINKQVHLIRPDILYRPGPRMLDGLLQMTQILHTQLTPDQFVSRP